jgi:hypothetical protein
MSGLGYALVALGVGAIVGLVAIWIRAGRDAFARALGAGMTVVGVVLLFLIGWQLWGKTEYGELLSLTLGQILVVLAAIIAAGLALTWRPHRA